MGYNPKPVNKTRYNTQDEAINAGEKFAKQGTDKGWYSTTALNGYAGQNLNYGGIIDMATPAMQAQWAQEDVDNARKQADDALNIANQQRDVQFQSMLDIQNQTQAAQAAADADRQRINDEAIRAQQEADRNAELGRQQAALTSANQKTDLTSENLVNIVAGATADQSAAATTAVKKKQGVGIASRVGINV